MLRCAQHDNGWVVTLSKAKGLGCPPSQPFAEFPLRCAQGKLREGLRVTAGGTDERPGVPSLLVKLHYRIIQDTEGLTPLDTDGEKQNVLLRVLPLQIEANASRLGTEPQSRTSIGRPHAHIQGSAHDWDH